MTSESPKTPPLDLLGMSVIVPEERLPLARVLERERVDFDSQLSVLTKAFRSRLIDGLGIDAVACFGKERSSDAAERAARVALDQARVAPASLGLIVDYSTLATDSPRIWSLAHHLQGRLKATHALALGTRGSGCAGLHLALKVTLSLFHSQPELDFALLVAADRAKDDGRCCLPVSIMADAATALIVARADKSSHRLGRLHAVELQQIGTFANVLVVDAAQGRMRIDGHVFERQVLPVHFVMLHRLLARALQRARIDASSLRAYVYPNTTVLDRKGVARGFRLDESSLVGPGPTHLGHAFASDLLINAETLLRTESAETKGPSAWLAAGSGFTWGAAIVEVGR